MSTMLVDDADLAARMAAGEDLEDESEMSEAYRDVLVATIAIAADLEAMSLPLMFTALLRAPDLDAKVAVAASIQDEMGHGLMMFRMLEDFGMDPDYLLFQRDPHEFRTFYLLEHGCSDYLEFLCMQALGDRAGFITTRDLGKYCSFAPYRRSLQKVNYEEKFHVAHGQRELKRLIAGDETMRARVQSVFDWMFPLAAEWFGVTDDQKKRTGQLTFRIRGASNDELREQWLKEVIPFADSIGIRVPAVKNADGSCSLTYQMPIMFDEETRTWDFERTVDWPTKFAQWKAGGPQKISGLRLLQGERWGASLWT